MLRIAENCNIYNPIFQTCLDTLYKKHYEARFARFKAISLNLIIYEERLETIVIYHSNIIFVTL